MGCAGCRRCAGQPKRVTRTPAAAASCCSLEMPRKDMSSASAKCFPPQTNQSAHQHPLRIPIAAQGSGRIRATAHAVAASGHAISALAPAESLRIAAHTGSLRSPVLATVAANGPIAPLAPDRAMIAAHRPSAITPITSTITATGATLAVGTAGDVRGVGCRRNPGYSSAKTGLLGRSGGSLQETLQGLLTDFVGKLEALDRAVADLLVMDVLPITGQTRVQAGDGLPQEGKADGSFAHAALGLPDGSAGFSRRQ